MRILFTGNVGESLPPPYAGIPKRALLLARAMREAGHAVGIAFVYQHQHEDDIGAGAEYFFDYAQQPTKLAKIFFIIRHFLVHPFLYVFLVWRYVRMHRFLSRECLVNAAHGVMLDGVVRQFRPDIMLSEAAIIRTFMAAQIAQRHNIPIVFDTYAEVHDASILKLRGGEIHRTEYWTKFLKIPDLIIAPSYYCGKGPEAYTPPGKVKVIYAGIEFEKYRSITLTKLEARRKFGLPEDSFLIIAVGSLAARKGHDHMLKAIAMLPLSISAHAVICGPGDATWLKDLARELGILDRVHFFSGLSEDDLIALYRAVDLYCDASNTPRACLGMSVTEAMAVSMPIIAYDTAGLPEIVKNNENGYLVPLDNIEKLSETLRRVYELSPSEYVKLSRSSVLLAGRLVDIKTCAKEMITTLEEVYRARNH